MKTIFLSRKTVQATAMLIVSLLWISATSVVFSQAQLVKDINVSESPYFIEYSQLTNAQGLFYFVSNGKELWKSDGTTAGTKRVRMVRGIQNLTLTGNVLYFGATNESASELWKSDGTYAGTIRVKQIRKGVNSSTTKSFTSVNGTVFFVADNGTGYELWKTNGTLSGTVLVKDIWRGTEGSEPSYLTVVNDMLYFSADDGVHGRELWKSDGTAAGTVMVRDIQTEEGQSSEPMELVTMNGFLFFSARNSLNGRELWRSDGTSSRTIRLKDINPGAASAEIGSIRRMGNAIYFNAKSGTTGTALWRSSGTTAGTVMLKDLTSDDSEFEVLDMTVLNNRIYWLVKLLVDHEVWVTNGTTIGTRLVTTFEDRHAAAQFSYINNKVYYFSGFWDHDVYGPVQQLCSINPDGSGWREIWRMRVPLNLDENLQYDYSPELLAFNNGLFFPGIRSDDEGFKLLKSTGAEAAPTLIIDTYRRTLSSSPTAMVKNNSYIYFTTQNNAWNDQNLWRTDGTKDGTIRLKSSPGAGNVVSVNNTAYFISWGDDSGIQLWKTDGSPTGTTLLKSLDHFPQLVDVGGTLFFYNEAGEVWKSDGTPAGTVLVKQFSSIEHLAASGSMAYILVRSASGGQELWKSNGLPAGTVNVRTIRWVEGPSISNHRTSATLGNVFYFVGNNGTHGPQLWRSDGTASGTFMVKNTRTGNNEDLHAIWRVLSFNNALYINAKDAAGEFSLFKSDGTSAGTQEIYDSYRIAEFMPYKDQLLFIAEGDSTQRLFTTDGTTAGTSVLHELPPNYGWWISHVQMNGILYFSYLGSDVLWRTDGTECGTFDLALGVRKIDNPIPVSSNLLLFSAYHDFYGEELFSVNVNDLPVPSCPEAFPMSQETETSDESEIKNVTYNPNPFDRDFTFVVNSNLQSTAEVAVYDMAGHPLTLDILETNKSHQLGRNWKEGVYIMRIFVDGKVMHKRVVKGRQ